MMARLGTAKNEESFEYGFSASQPARTASNLAVMSVQLGLVSDQTLN